MRDSTAHLTRLLVSDCLDIVQRRFHDPTLTLRSAARELGVSPWHLSRLITRITGHGFHWHLQQVRLNEASSLLRHTRLLVKEITAAVGYKQVSDLDRAFRSRFGLTPTNYRGQVLDLDHS
jgi:AraC-like DNA-binding protein